MGSFGWRKRTKEARAWLFTLLFLAACVIGLSLYRERHSIRETPEKKSGALPNPATQTQQNPTGMVKGKEAVAAKASDDSSETTSEKLKKPVRFWALDKALLGSYLHDADLGQAGAILDLLEGRDKEQALAALREVMNDTASPGRLQALQLLLNWSKLEPDTLEGVFVSALDDVDSGCALVAVGTLVGRTDEQAISLLTKAYQEGETERRLMIVQSVSPDSAASQILNQAAADLDPTVRSSALAILSPPGDEELQQSPIP